MVDILPGSYSSPSGSTVACCIDQYHYIYIWHNGKLNSHEPLSHGGYWKSPEDPWIYIAPNELNRW